MSTEIITPQAVHDRLAGESSRDFARLVDSINAQLARATTLAPTISIHASIPEVTRKAVLDKFRNKGWTIVGGRKRDEPYDQREPGSGGSYQDYQFSGDPK